MKKKDIIFILDKIKEELSNAKKIDTLEVHVEQDCIDVPNKFWMEKKPSGWMNLTFNVRWLKSIRNKK
jgi:hypothetical protein